MRIKILLLSVALCSALSLFVRSYVSDRFVARLEEGQVYSLGLASESRLFTFSEKTQEEPRIVSESLPESKSKEAVQEKPKAASVFYEGGSISMCFEEEYPDLELSVKSKVPIDEELVYRSFAFQGRLPELKETLSDAELCYVFSKIVASCTPAVPLKGKLEQISFEKKEDHLNAYAEIYLDFTGIAKQYHIGWLPEGAHFSISIPFLVKKSEISVISDKIVLICDTFPLPEALLVFGCNMAFGKRDYRTLFGEAVKNVFLNAKIYT